MITIDGTKRYLGTPKLTPLQLIWTVLAIFFFIFMDTEVFNAFSDMTKIMFYAFVVTVCVLLGVSLISVKKIAEDMKVIYLNKNLSPIQKVNAYGNLALTVLGQLGLAFELLNEVQFDTNEKRIEEVKKELESL